MESSSIGIKTPREIDAILHELRSGLEQLYGPRLRALQIYGSYARGDARPGSDIDVLVVLDRVPSYTEEIRRASQPRAEVALRHDVSISLAYVPEESWRRMDLPLVRNARREGRAA